MNYTVKQLAKIAHVSPRTLRYYDKIGLLKPSTYRDNGYRQYSQTSLMRLQQILFFRELDFSLKEIQQIIDQPNFETEQALRNHRESLQNRIGRLEQLINTIDTTLLRIKGESIMNDEELYQGFDPEKQEEYETEIEERFGTMELNQSRQRWGSYSQARQKQIIAEGETITKAIHDNMDKGHKSTQIQEQIHAYYNHMQNFYDCSLDTFRGLGQLYTSDPRFSEMYKNKYHPDLPEFLEKAISHYCDQNS